MAHKNKKHKQVKNTVNEDEVIALQSLFKEPKKAVVVGETKNEILCGDKEDCFSCEFKDKCHTVEEVEKLDNLFSPIKVDDENVTVSSYNIDYYKKLYGKTTLYENCKHKIDDEHPELFGLQPVRFMGYSIPYESLSDFSGWIMLDTIPLKDYDIFNTQIINPLILHVVDRTAPSKEQMDAIVSYLEERTKTGKVIVSCMGGHGRTGTILAVWCGLHLDKQINPIKYVRENYCKEAVECVAQEEFVYKYLGRKVPKSLKKRLKQSFKMITNSLFHKKHLFDYDW